MVRVIFRVLEVEAMATSEPCTIKLLNKNWQIKCPKKEVANLKLAAEKLELELTQNKKKFGHLDELQNLLLAALHISHELIASQKLEERQRQKIADFMSALEKKHLKKNATPSEETTA